MASEDAESTYPLNEWMVPSQDAHGHSAKVICRLPPSYKHEMAVILQKRRYPWDTESDLVRVAIHRLLQAVAKDSKDPEIMSQQAILNALVEMSSRQMEYAHFKATLDRLKVSVQELSDMGAHVQAKKMVRAVEEQIEKFEDDDWRGRYEAEIVKHFKFLATEKKGKGEKEKK
jgi:hypothetical protein